MVAQLLQMTVWTVLRYTCCDAVGWTMGVSLPYLTGKACYRLVLRPPVGPMRIPNGSVIQHVNYSAAQSTKLLLCCLRTSLDPEWQW